MINGRDQTAGFDDGWDCKPVDVGVCGAQVGVDSQSVNGSVGVGVGGDEGGELGGVDGWMGSRRDFTAVIEVGLVGLV